MHFVSPHENQNVPGNIPWNVLVFMFVLALTIYFAQRFAFTIVCIDQVVTSGILIGWLEFNNTAHQKRKRAMYRSSSYLRIGVMAISLIFLLGCQQVADTVATPSRVRPDTTLVVTETLAGRAAEEPTSEPTEGQSLPFETVSQGSSLTAEQETPLLVVARSESELSAITSRIDDPESVAKVTHSDLNNGAVVAVFSGLAPSSGYGITIRSIQLLDGEMQISVELTEPQADEMSASVLSYPYHVVQLSANIPASETGMSWTVRTLDGTILVTTD